MKLFTLLALALLAGSSARAQPVPFCEAIVPRTLLTKMKEAPRWESDWSNEVVLQPLSAEAQQELFDHYRGRVPKPKLEATQQIAPMFPFSMSQKGITGKVMAYLVVAKNGSVKAVYVTDYDQEAFAKAAALSLQLWDFARIKEECLVKIPVPFTKGSETAAP
jgi:hypothetical protein